MTSALSLRLSIVTSLLFSVTAVTMFLTYWYAIRSDGQEITWSFFYISHAWNHEQSRISANIGIPLVAGMVAMILAAKYLQLHDAFPMRRSALRLARASGLISALLLIGTCAITIDKTKGGQATTHLVLAFCCFSCAYTSVSSLGPKQSGPVAHRS
jgi:hypothetical protein